MVIIKINTDNAAFDEDYWAEVAFILQELSSSLTGGLSNGSRKIRDVNGNTVGSVVVTGLRR